MLIRQAVLCVFVLSGTACGQQAIDGWGTVVDRGRDCTVRIEQGKLIVKVPAGLHDLWKGQKDEGKRFNAPRVLREVQGDFTIRVKVSTDSQPGAGQEDIPALQKLTGITGTHPYQGVGLLVWDTEQHYLRHERGRIIHAKGTTLTVPWYVRDGARVNDVKVTPDALFKGRSTWMQLTRRGQQVAAAISHDGQTWNVMGNVTTTLPARVQVGVAAVNVSNRELVAEFEGLKMTNP